MRNAAILSLLAVALAIAVRTSSDDDVPLKFPIKAEFLPSAQTEKDILRWAKERSENVNSERFTFGDATLLVVLANPPTGFSRTDIYVYTGFDKDEKKDQGTNRGWGLLLYRRAGTSTVKVEADKKVKRLTFISRAGKTLLVLPLENIDFWAEADGEANPAR